MVMDGLNANKPNCHNSLQMDTLAVTIKGSYGVLCPSPVHPWMAVVTCSSADTLVRWVWGALMVHG